MNKLILLGVEHCRSVFDSLEQAGCYDEIILLDKEEQSGKTVGSYVISGTDEELSRLYQEGCRELFITVGSIKDTKTRHRLAEWAIGLGFRLINIIDPTVAASDMVQIGNWKFHRKACGGKCRLPYRRYAAHQFRSSGGA